MFVERVIVYPTPPNVRLAELIVSYYLLCRRLRYICITKHKPWDLLPHDAPLLHTWLLLSVASVTNRFIFLTRNPSLCVHLVCLKNMFPFV